MNLARRRILKEQLSGTKFISFNPVRSRGYDAWPLRKASRGGRRATGISSLAISASQHGRRNARSNTAATRGVDAISTLLRQKHYGGRTRDELACRRSFAKAFQSIE